MVWNMEAGTPTTIKVTETTNTVIKKETNLLRIWTLMDLFAEPKLLVATQVNVPTVSGDTFTHCNVEVPLERPLVVEMVMDSLLLLRGSPLCIHSNKGKGTPLKLHISVKVPFMSNNSKRLFVVVTSGAANIMRRENTITNYFWHDHHWVTIKNFRRLAMGTSWMGGRTLGQKHLG